jgi:DNA (cytosine-5)-methyltransferase 1
MTHASLCTGIGGFDLAAKWMGWKNIFQCEIDPFCQKVLRYHFPECELFTDIKTSNFTKYANRIDVISAGFPCQPFSVAGKRKGTDDDRYLWDEVLRVINEVQPRWFVGENVSGLLTQQSGVVFEGVCTDLENSGYEVQSFVIPACAVNAPHRRDRVFILAHRTNTGIEGVQQRENGICEFEPIANAKSVRCKQSGKARQRRNGFENSRIVANTPSGRWIQNNKRKQTRQSEQNIPSWREFPSQSPVCTGNDGFSYGLADITFSKWRRESIKALGNGVVPQLVYQIFKAIETI